RPWGAARWRSARSSPSSLSPLIDPAGAAGLLETKQTPVEEGWTSGEGRRPRGPRSPVRWRSGAGGTVELGAQLGDAGAEPLERVADRGVGAGERVRDVAEAVRRVVEGGLRVREALLRLGAGVLGRRRGVVGGRTRLLGRVLRRRDGLLGAGARVLGQRADLVGEGPHVVPDRLGLGARVVEELLDLVAREGEFRHAHRAVLGAARERDDGGEGRAERERAGR